MTNAQKETAIKNYRIFSSEDLNDILTNLERKECYETCAIVRDILLKRREDKLIKRNHGDKEVGTKSKVGEVNI